MLNTFGKYQDFELFSALKLRKRTAERAFAELYSRYSQKVYAYCYRISGNTEDAKDIFQETFLKFYDYAHKNSEIENVGGLLIKIARNYWLNLQRNHRNCISFDDLNFSENGFDYEQKELVGLIASALDLLDFDQREAFILRQYHGMSYKEISDITGVTITNLKNRVWRAKEKIKNILQPYMQDS